MRTRSCSPPRFQNIRYSAGRKPARVLLWSPVLHADGSSPTPRSDVGPEHTLPPVRCPWLQHLWIQGSGGPASCTPEKARSVCSPVHTLDLWSRTSWLRVSCWCPGNTGLRVQARCPSSLQEEGTHQGPLRAWGSHAVSSQPSGGCRQHLPRPGRPLCAHSAHLAGTKPSPAPWTRSWAP